MKIPDYLLKDWNFVVLSEFNKNKLNYYLQTKSFFIKHILIKLILYAIIIISTVVFKMSATNDDTCSFVSIMLSMGNSYFF